jgi:hypothetical protein
MVQFLSINFFLGFLQFLLGFSNVHVFLCHPVHGVNVVRQAALHITQRIVPEQCDFEVEMVTGKLKRSRSPGVDQIPAELIKASCKRIGSEIHKLINSI